MMIFRLVARAAALMKHVAAFALVFMMMVTVVDIVMRWTINTPIFGAFELVEFTLVCVVFLALPQVFATERHITVNILDEVMPRALVRWLKRFAAFAALVFMALLGRYMIAPAYDAWDFGDRTMDLGMPVIWFWAPMLLGVGISILICTICVVRTARGADAGMSSEYSSHDA
ncbi:TRAP transporter small permease [Breoghania sp. L-A4]|uniref:TRAP transporter small permease n=1 Tax=Breoghania sp. L-A4 TaxID=2304600 RepID=UPI000E359FDD|nr:TRAP transporter small permease [Breoghania sp. L-A4]AXS42172.1 TRAP transporter small permease [Breoghania sp. L-A4]